ncbi:MAG: alpha-galactosidase [Planctomycetota bacterium]
MSALSAIAGEAFTPGPEELAQKDEWVRQNLLAQPGGTLPFSFTYGGQPSAALLPAWEKKAKDSKLDEQRTEHTLTWTDPQSGLAVRCRAVEYHDFPTVEWTLYFKNAGAKESPILENIQALDVKLSRKLGDEFVLHHHTGDNCSARSYEPHQTRLEPKSKQAFAPAGGRATNGAYPYYNLEYDGGGVIAVLGWPGQWAARFERDETAGLRVSGGQELTHFKLLPGEEVRSPLVVLQFWKGDWIRSQNIWRRWMIAHNLPRPGGKLPPPFTSACMGLHQSETSEIGYINEYLKGGVKLDYWWMDAGWYPCRDWPETGTWEPDPQRFPKGIRAVSDYAHSKDMKLVLWFEPERVHAGTWLHKTHPEWLLKGQLLNLGNPEAREWLTAHIDKFLTEQGIDLYRQDFNMDPLSCWRSGDAQDRQGITEIRHVEGYLAYWDELLRRHPGMLIDSCASGGRRNDLETLRRAVPLLRSDYQAPQNPSDGQMLVGNQGHTYGLSFWVPYYGTGIFYDDVYAVRSHLTPAFGIGYPAGAAKVDWAAFRRRIEDWKKVAGFFYGDYYPLTPYSLSESAWIAWQFNQPGTEAGMIQAFRRTQNQEASASLKLRGLDPAAAYEFTDLDLENEGRRDADAPNEGRRDAGGTQATTRAAGRTLMEKGLVVKLPNRRQAALLTYKRINALAAVLSASVETCEVDQPVALSGADSCAPGGEIAGYSWDLGDGTTASGPAAEHAYKTPGTYTVALTVKDRQGAAHTASARITVTPADTTAPALAAAMSGKKEKVVVVFSKPVEQAGAETAANYALDQGAKVLAAALGPDLRRVTLTTSPLSEGVDYTLTVANVKDRAWKANTLAPGSRLMFRCSGLLAHWKLDEGQGDWAYDCSGNEHHGRLLGANGPPAWAEKALSFGGNGAFVESDTCFPDLALPFSIALWVKPAATQEEYADILGNHGEPRRGLVIQQDLTKTNVFGFGCGNGKEWQGAGSVQLQADQWQSLAVVCDGEHALIYVDGIEKARGQVKGPFAPNPNQNFKLGQGYLSDRYFHGQLSDVRIFPRALSAKEVEERAKASKQV